jgi:hypothetical protein|tara:strand:+ start:351 stop:560 length:210 start_codon:yes stop_codon:yes gene_type:complete
VPRGAVGGPLHNHAGAICCFYPLVVILIREVPLSFFEGRIYFFALDGLLFLLPRFFDKGLIDHFGKENG